MFISCIPGTPPILCETISNSFGFLLPDDLRSEIISLYFFEFDIILPSVNAVPLGASIF